MEEWRTVKQNDNYAVSSYGRVKRVKSGMGATKCG